MRCKDMKRHIKKLEKENRELTSRNCALKSMDERRYPFNLLEIVVRPSRQEHLIRYECVGLDLRVVGDTKMPTICNYKTIQLSAFDLLRENEANFIKGIGELAAKELMAYGREKK